MKVPAMAYQQMVDECRKFLNTIDSSEIVDAKQMDAHVFSILRSATSVVEQQQAEYLDFMCLDGNDEKFDEWIKPL